MKKKYYDFVVEVTDSWWFWIVLGILMGQTLRMIFGT